MVTGRKPPKHPGKRRALGVGWSQEKTVGVAEGAVPLREPIQGLRGQRERCWVLLLWGRKY